MTSKLESALALAARGFKVFPLKPGAKSPPLLADWPAKATADPAAVGSFWKKWPTANIGIHCEGLLVVDVDVKKGGDDSLQFLEMAYGFPDTLTTITPSGGRHLLFRRVGGAVANSVEVLGRGLDIRSAGGYIVAPGSSAAGGDYRFAADTPVADAPDWLVQKLGTFTPREKTQKLNVPDAPPEVLERALEWLKAQGPAIEGQGGDARTFAVVCGLRDFGVSAIQAFAALQDDWNRRCLPEWDNDDLWQKVRNAYSYGQNAPGGAAARADEFPVLTPTPKAKPRARLARLSAFADSETKGPGYLVKGLLQRRSYAETFGQPGEGKTFVALDQGYCVAAGLPWMGRKTHQGVVLYLAYEGQGGLVKRAQALHKKYGTKDIPLYIAGAAYNLRDVAGRQELGALIAELPEKPVFIIIDTFARALMGGDENSAQDVGAFNAGIAALIEHTGACVMIIHHSGKNKSAGARGSSALLGAVDTEVEVDGGQIKASKQREIEAGEPIGFKLVPTIVGLDEDNDEVTSCVIEPDTVSKGPSGQMSGNVKRAFQVLCELRPDNKPVTDVEWKEACSGFLSQRKAAFWDIKDNLRRRQLIDVDAGGMTTRRME